ARAVLGLADEFGLAVQLRSAPGAAAYAGVGYLHALGEAAGHELVIDCLDDPGLVMAALRTGCRKIVFSGAHNSHQRLAEMAEQQNSAVRHEENLPDSLLILSSDDLEAAAAGPWLLAITGGG
ncbi:MAG: hypothetical protein ACR2Q4_15015, partial [Geminicoccaceae bacterium]